MDTPIRPPATSPPSRWIVAAAALCWLAAPGATSCTQTDPPVAGDAGPDARSDARRDARPDSQQPRHDTTDAATDAFFDQMFGDVTLVDSTLAGATVLYTPASQTSSFGLRTASSDGTQQPAVITAWAGLIDFEPLQLTGLQEALPVTSSVPRPATELDSSFQGIVLPGGLGTLYYFHRKLKGTSGLLQVKPDGALNTLLEVQGIYKDTLSDRLALTADGKRGAALQETKQVLLFRTDGGTFSPGGASSVDISPAAALAVSGIKPLSLTFAGGYLFCVAQVSSGPDLLLRAPQDGSKPLEQVSLPKVSDAAPAHISDGLAVSADGAVLAVLAGPSASQRDLLAVTVASGAATNLTQAAGQIAERGALIGQLEGQLALSAQGSLAAYVVANQELYVVKTDGSAKPVHITDQLRFKVDAVVQVNLLFSDDSNLLWMAGSDISQLDLYRYDGATGQVFNLSGYGSTSLPFDGQGAMRPLALWPSPNGKWIYWIEYLKDKAVTDLRALELATMKVHSITSGAEVQASAGMFAACAGSGKLFFVAEPDPVKNNREIWVYDRDDGSKPALKLTTMSNTPTSTWYIFNLRLSDDCSRLAYTAGGSYWLRNLWLLDTAKGPGTAQKVTAVPLYLHQSFRFTPDRSTLVYGGGGSPETSTLKAVPLPPGGPLTLDPTAGYVHIFAVY